MNWDTRNVLWGRVNVTTGPFVSLPGNLWCSSPMAGIHKLRWAFDMNLGALPGQDSAPKKWKMPRRQLRAVQRTEGERTAAARPRLRKDKHGVTDLAWNRGKGAYRRVLLNNNGSLVVERNEGNSASLLPRSVLLGLSQVRLKLPGAKMLTYSLVFLPTLGSPSTPCKAYLWPSSQSLGDQGSAAHIKREALGK